MYLCGNSDGLLGLHYSRCPSGIGTLENGEGGQATPAQPAENVADGTPLSVNTPYPGPCSKEKR